MAARANWKGVLNIGELSCSVALYTAASTAERIAFHILNRKTGHRVHREFVDAETGERVEAKEQVKGYEIGAGDYIAFEPEEIAKAVPEADKTLEVQAFVPCGQVDDVYFDRPYYLAPSSPAGAEAFALIRDAMAAPDVAAIARTVLFRRVRSVLVRAHGDGLIAQTLNFDYEDAVAPVVALQAQGLATQGRSLSTPAPLRAFRPRTPDPARSWPVVGEGVKSCPRAGCGQSASPVR